MNMQTDLFRLMLCCKLEMRSPLLLLAKPIIQYRTDIKLYLSSVDKNYSEYYQCFESGSPFSLPPRSGSGSGMRDRILIAIYSF
jgi:hypothetical protein